MGTPRALQVCCPCRGHLQIQDKLLLILCLALLGLALRIALYGGAAC